MGGELIRTMHGTGVAGVLMWARLGLQLPAVGGRMPTEHGMHKHGADAVAGPDWTWLPEIRKPV